MLVFHNRLQKHIFKRKLIIFKKGTIFKTLAYSPNYLYLPTWHDFTIVESIFVYIGTARQLEEPILQDMPKHSSTLSEAMQQVLQLTSFENPLFVSSKVSERDVFGWGLRQLLFKLIMQFKSKADSRHELLKQISIAL